MSYAAGQVSLGLLNWNGPQRRVNLEAFTRETELLPGQSLTLEQRWEIARPGR